MTKTPALFIIPIIAIAPILIWSMEDSRKLHDLLFLEIIVGVAGLIGTVLFFSLRISPLFGDLFTRSGDFTFTISEIIRGEWRFVLFHSFPRDIGWIVSYLLPLFSMGSLLSLWKTKTRKQGIFLLSATLLFAVPLILIGRVLYPRYFLPSAFFLTLAASLGLGELSVKGKSKWIALVLFSIVMIQSFLFIIPSYLAVGEIPFVQEDKVQYLTDWSAGFGNAEVRDFIINRVAALPQGSKKKIIVLTEGSFGTLPDGLLMYFHSSTFAQHVEIHGIGLTVLILPKEYVIRSQSDEVYYMVNSNRFSLIDQGNIVKVLDIPRPAQGAHLLLWRVKTTQ